MEAKRKKTNKATESTKQVLNKRTSKSSSAKRPASSSKGKNHKSKDTRSERLFNEKLKSLSDNIDLIQKIIKRTDMDTVEVQGMFRTIFNDINFFLKSLPQIKNNELITAYNKAYKKLDDLIKSVNFNFDGTNNQIENIELDENNFLVEKVKDDTTILYRTKYIHGNVIINIFSEDGKQVYKYKIKPDGSKEASYEKHYEKYIDESQFPSKDRMIVNKEFYKNINNGELFNLNVITPLFEFIALQSALSKKKYQKNINVIVSLNIKEHKYLSLGMDSALHNNNETVDIYSDNKEIAEVENKNIPIFGDVAIYKGKNNLLYSGPKVGKSYLSIEIAKSKYIKKPLFIALDNLDPKSDQRYLINLKDKIFSLINLDNFDAKYETELNERKKQAKIETIKDINFKDYHRIKYYNRQNYIEMGIIKEKSDKLDKIAVIEKIIIEALDNDHDFICLDCLNSIVEDSGRNFYREDILKIIKPLSGRNVTLLILHHTTKQKNKMALTQELRNIFDNIYFLEEKERIDNHTTDLELIEEEARDNAPHTLTLRRKINTNFLVHFEIIKSDISQPNRKNNRKNINSFILEIIMDNKKNKKKIILYKSLITKLKEVTGKENIDEANIMKLLKKLKEEEGIIEMKNGSTWKGGILILK